MKYRFYDHTERKTIIHNSVDEVIEHANEFIDILNDGYTPSSFNYLDPAENLNEATAILSIVYIDRIR